MSTNTVDSLLVSSQSQCRSEMAESQGGTPREKEEIFQKRMIELDQDAKVKIAKLKTLLPHSTEKEDAISLLETFSVNDRYEDREKKGEKIDILIEKNVV